MLKETKYYQNKSVEELKKSDIEKLAKVLEYHSDLYYNQDAPVISDSEYDLLLKKLAELELKYESKQKKSVKVGAEIISSSFEKVAHTRPMISLDNTYNEEELQKFDERVEKLRKKIDENETQDRKYCLEYKFDWLWVELIYKNWELIQAITRWNGLVWEDVTQNILWIANIPKTIAYKEYLEIRWEVVLPISEFHRLNAEAKQVWWKVFSNPRNAASGSVRMKDSSITKSRNLKFYAYDIWNFTEYVKNIWEKSYQKVILSLEKLGFSISDYFEKYSIQKIIQVIENFDEYKKNLDYEIDWLVLKYDNITIWQDIGFTEHHPRYAIAYKFPAQVLSTTILSVDAQVGRTGTITPAANLEPINIGWVIVKRATLHNYDEVEKLDVRVWDRIFIKRAWEVIPKVISVALDNEHEQREKIKPPQNCPSCWNDIQKDEDKVRFYCPNSVTCPKQREETLIYAVGKSGFDIDGFWEQQVRLFLELWWLHDIADIFAIKNYKDQLLKLDWYKQKSVDKLIASIEKSKSMNIEVFLRSLWIPWVWKKTAKNIAQLFRSEQDILKFSYGLKTIENIWDIGPETAYQIKKFFSDKKQKKVLEKLLSYVSIEYYTEKKENNWVLSWKKVCITGSFLYNWEKVSRESLVVLVEKHGWDFVGSVSKTTDILVAWEKAGSKLEKAKKFNIKVIDLAEFIKLLWVEISLLLN